MIVQPQIMRGSTVHARLGKVKNDFRYNIDFALLDLNAKCLPALFSRNRANAFAFNDRDHGGPVGAGAGVTWAEQVFADAGLSLESIQILLLAQPRIFGRAFNPVSFWFAVKDDNLFAVIAEVNNTFGDRHCYLCHLPNFMPIGPNDKIVAAKFMHVSPFQDEVGRYTFNFSLKAAGVVIRIAYDNSGEGVVANLVGQFAPMTNWSLVSLLLRRPLSPVRTKFLIHWQAMRLFIKGVRYRPRPRPPVTEVSS
jgi:DUF1365 family protein